MTPEDDNALVTWRHVLEMASLTSPGTRKALTAFVEHARQRVESELAAGNAVIASDLSVFADQATNLLEQDRMAQGSATKPLSDDMPTVPRLNSQTGKATEEPSSTGTASTGTSADPSAHPQEHEPTSALTQLSQSNAERLDASPSPTTGDAQPTATHDTGSVTTSSDPQQSETPAAQSANRGSDSATGGSSPADSDTSRSTPPNERSVAKAPNEAQSDVSTPAQMARHDADTATGASPAPGTDASQPETPTDTSTAATSADTQQSDTGPTPAQQATPEQDVATSGSSAPDVNTSRPETSNDIASATKSPESQRTQIEPAPTSMANRGSAATTDGSSAPVSGSGPSNETVSAMQSAEPQRTDRLPPPMQLAHRGSDTAVGISPMPNTNFGQDGKPVAPGSDKPAIPTMTPAPRVMARTASDQAAAAAFASRGDAMVVLKDISAARKYYEYAANAGNARAALALGETYDPAFLSRLGTLGLKPNPTIAADWYRKAAALGDRVASGRLQALALEAAK